MTHTHHLLLATFAAAALSSLTVFGQPEERTSLDGVYTDAQAERGTVEYSRHCARCHGDNLDGIGAAAMLYSSRFIDRWREDALSGLYEYIARNMPLDPNAARLTEAQYLDLVAYLLYVNDLPAGSRELESKDLAMTLLVGPEGPKPLPPSTTVRVVGCLAQSAGAWTLVRASTPARVRKADATDAAELEQSARTPLGTQEFRLPNLTEGRQTSELTTHLAKKVQIKGVLNGQAPDARVSVLSFEPLAQDCQK